MDQPDFEAITELQNEFVASKVTEMLVYDCQRNTLRLSDVSVWRCGSFSVHGVLSSGLMCEGPVSTGKRRTARTQDLVSTCLCRASAWAFRL